MELVDLKELKEMQGIYSTRILIFIFPPTILADFSSPFLLFISIESGRRRGARQRRGIA